jgi:predicted protein tyrosine phosphatase
MMHVLDRQSLLSAIKEKPGELTCVIIIEPDMPQGMVLQSLSKTNLKDMNRLPKDKIISRFWDVDDPTRKDCPSEFEIRRILDWAKDKEVDIVACHAGISRSSAVAILIECQKIFAGRPVTVKEAIEGLMLNKDQHHPNPLILELGAKILNRPEIPDVVKYWNRGGVFV